MPSKTGLNGTHSCSFGCSGIKTTLIELFGHISLEKPSQATTLFVTGTTTVFAGVLLKFLVVTANNFLPFFQLLFSFRIVSVQQNMRGLAPIVGSHGHVHVQGEHSKHEQCGGRHGKIGMDFSQKPHFAHGFHILHKALLLTEFAWKFVLRCVWVRFCIGGSSSDAAA